MKKKIIIQLKTIPRLKNFVRVVEKLPYDVDAIQGRYRIPANSIMGMFSLDLMQDIAVEAITDNKEELNDFYMQMYEFTKGVE